jgi:hypothetical protein
MAFDGGYMHAGGPLGPPVEWVVRQQRTNGPWARHGLPGGGAYPPTRMSDAERSALIARATRFTTATAVDAPPFAPDLPLIGWLRKTRLAVVAGAVVAVSAAVVVAIAGNRSRTS